MDCGDQAHGDSGAIRPEGLLWLRGHLESLGAGVLWVCAGSRTGRASHGCTAPWPGRCARGGGGNGK